MEQTVAQLSSRLNKIETEYTVASRRRAESAARAFKAIQDISPEDVELVKGIVPSLPLIRSFTEQNFIENLNGEIEMVRKAAEDLRTYVEQRLAFYEEQL